MQTELLNLPWQIQVALAAGYSGYMLAYVGLRHTHRQIDTIFISVVFSLIASGAISLAARWSIESLYSAASAFAVTCIVAVTWRRWGRKLLTKALRGINLSWGNDDPSALVTLSLNSEYPISQIAVLLDDGTWLRCDNTAIFNDAPFAPFLLGPNGDVALYLTHEEKIGEEAKELKSVRDSHYGDRITYVPASQIRQINFRHVSR